MKTTGKSRAGHGGARPGAGRTSKAAMMGLQALLDKCWTAEDRQACIEKLASKASTGDMEAIKLLMAYTFGRPKESVTVDANVRHTVTAEDMSDDELLSIARRGSKRTPSKEGGA